MVQPIGTPGKFNPYAPSSAEVPVQASAGDELAGVSHELPVVGVNVQKLIAPFEAAYGPKLPEAVCKALQIDPASTVSGGDVRKLDDALHVAAQAMNGVNAAEEFLGALRRAPDPR